MWVFIHPFLSYWSGPSEMVFIMRITLCFHYSMFCKIFTFFQIVIPLHMELCVKIFLVEFILPLFMRMHALIISSILCIKPLQVFILQIINSKMTSQLVIKFIKAMPASFFPISAKFDQSKQFHGKQVFEPLEGFFSFSFDWIVRISNGEHKLMCVCLFISVYKTSYTKKIAKFHVFNFTSIEKLIHRNLYFRKEPF